jgi:hypothetical protein
MIENSPPASLRKKMERVKAGVDGWQSAGRDPSRIGQIMQEFEPLMREGKLKDAEEVLDRALKVLGEGEGNNVEDKSARPEKK